MKTRETAQAHGKEIITPEERSVIRGCWRNGATTEQISVQLGISHFEVVRTIESFYNIKLPQ